MQVQHSNLSSQLDQIVEVLELVEDPTGTWTWRAVRKVWAKVALTASRKQYTAVGVWARGAELILRRQELTLHNALRWRGQHLFITSVLENDRDRLEVDAALVTVSACENDDGTVKFPAVMTEKYLSHDQLEPHAVNYFRHVLVTPKVIALTPGKWVVVDGVDWPITVPHTLDPWHNEYELEREVDL